MNHSLQWSAAFASYFTFMGLWVAFGPGALMASNPGAAPMALAALTLSYFVSTPVVRVLWREWGFSKTLVLMGGGVAGSLCLAALVPQWLAWCAPLAFFFGTGSYTLCETKLLEDLAHTGQSHAFGRARKWGSFGFLAAASLGGAVLSFSGMGPAFDMALGLSGLIYLACCIALARAADRTAPETAPEAAPETAHVPASAATPAPAAHPRSDATPSYNTPQRKRLGAAAITCMRLADAISATWFGAYWLATGHSPLETGLLCALPVAAEFLAMWKGGRLLARYSAPALMLLCGALSLLRWLATPHCSQLWCAIPIQSVHAFTFGLFYPASLIWLKQAYADHFFEVRYVTESVSRALTAVVSYAAASWVIASLGFGALYAVSSALAVLGCLWWLRMLRVVQAT